MAAFPVNHKNHMMGIHKEKQREIKNSWYIKKKKNIGKRNMELWCLTDWLRATRRIHLVNSNNKECFA